jgi:hypothetical protein
MFRKRRVPDEPVVERADTDILCPNEAAARAEAARRQQTETEGAEWIYLRRDQDKQWVARRWTGQDDKPNARTSRADVVVDLVGEVINPVNWFQ